MVPRALHAGAQVRLLAGLAHQVEQPPCKRQARGSRPRAGTNNPVTQMFNNASALEFSDISSEKWREYRFAGGDVVRVDAPERLNVSGSGGHRIFDAAGVSHYIPAGWVHLRWMSKPGMPHFVL